LGFPKDHSFAGDRCINQGNPVIVPPHLIELLDRSLSAPCEFLSNGQEAPFFGTTTNLSDEGMMIEAFLNSSFTMTIRLFSQVSHRHETKLTVLVLPFFAIPITPAKTLTNFWKTIIEKPCFHRQII
jgi:hypothetical protein